MELSALGFQTLVTALLSLVYFGLWRHRRRPYHATWGAAWAVYALRLQFITAYIVTRHSTWLFLHQVATAVSVLLLLYAALQFSRGSRWPARTMALWILVAIAASAALVYGVHNQVVSGILSVVALSAVTLWTGIVFWRYRLRHPSGGATLLAIGFTLWGIHHLDYPLLRPLGSGVLFGVFADVLLIVVTAVGAVFLVLGHERNALESRSLQLEQLTKLLLRAQEDERRRIARELHDEAGQILTAVKIDLDLSGRRESAELVGRALAQVRNLSNLLRPPVLDDLGLLPALRAMVEDFSARTRIHTELFAPHEVPALSPEHQVAIYRIVQEALTNVARHAAAGSAQVRLSAYDHEVRLEIEDDGRGATRPYAPHLGLLGMRERVTTFGGTLDTHNVPEGGFRVTARIPTGDAA